MDNFAYIVDKIANAKLSYEPFRHLYIENFFSDGDFEQIVNSPEVNITPKHNDIQLVSGLYEQNFKVIKFPGTTSNIPAYLEWHKERPVNRMTDVNCEGFGVALRLQKTLPGTMLRQISAFFASRLFWETLANRFEIDMNKVAADIGLQKYLDGYEISPHPDVRRKALTFMINVNPASDSEFIDYHTRYMRFKPEYRYIQTYWEKNPKVDRCWVSWDSCEIIKQQTKNNSMVIFSPADDTIHAVKARYDHLRTQRTQFYGNLWYRREPTTSYPLWNEILSLAKEAA